MSTPCPPSDEPLSQEPHDSSLVLGGPLFQLWRRTRLAGDALQCCTALLTTLLMSEMPERLLKVMFSMPSIPAHRKAGT